METVLRKDEQRGTTREAEPDPQAADTVVMPPPSPMPKSFRIWNHGFAASSHVVTIVTPRTSHSPKFHKIFHTFDRSETDCYNAALLDPVKWNSPRVSSM